MSHVTVSRENDPILLVIILIDHLGRWPFGSFWGSQQEISSEGRQHLVVALDNEMLLWHFYTFVLLSTEQAKPWDLVTCFKWQKPQIKCRRDGRTLKRHSHRSVRQNGSNWTLPIKSQLTESPFFVVTVVQCRQRDFRATQGTERERSWIWAKESRTRWEKV